MLGATLTQILCTTFTEAYEALEIACKDTAGDLGIKEVDDSMYWDLAHGIMECCTAEVAYELSRVTGVGLPERMR
jgi:hypothetical protein